MCKNSIAAVVLALNEENNLPRALSSLTWCNELVVLDSGSTDSTCQVAHRYKARFIQNIQAGPFKITDQRNWVLDHGSLSSDWILFLDADEEVGLELAQAIYSVINSVNPFDAY